MKKSKLTDMHLSSPHSFPPMGQEDGRYWLECSWVLHLPLFLPLGQEDGRYRLECTWVLRLSLFPLWVKRMTATDWNAPEFCTFLCFPYGSRGWPLLTGMPLSFAPFFVSPVGQEDDCYWLECPWVLRLSLFLPKGQEDGRYRQECELNNILTLENAKYFSCNMSCICTFGHSWGAQSW